jgi:hypothetical protein
MPDQNLPSPQPDLPERRDQRPALTATLSSIGANAYATAVRDPRSGVVSVTLGSADVRLQLLDDPAQIHVLLTDAIAQLDAIDYQNESGQ